jgi:hypothetical protein
MVIKNWVLKITRTQMVLLILFFCFLSKMLWNRSRIINNIKYPHATLIQGLLTLLNTRRQHSFKDYKQHKIPAHNTHSSIINKIEYPHTTLIQGLYKQLKAFEAWLSLYKAHYPSVCSLGAMGWGGNLGFRG